MTESEPLVTVIVTLVSGKPQHLKSCLGALIAQFDAPTTEVLIPYDEPVAEVRDLEADFPQARFILAEGLDTSVARTGSSREHHDTLRTIGLKQARGQVVAMIEDVGVANSGWCRALLGALERHPEAGVVGGAMNCGSERLLNRAVCYNDYLRYQEPLPEMQSAYVSDANLAYRRAALDAVRDVWDKGYHETLVHFAMADRGYEVWLAPGATVSQSRTGLSWKEALRERYVWGRSFAGTRVQHASLIKRMVYAGLSPLLPLLLTSRIMRIAVQRGGFFGLLPALPSVLLLTTAWAFGEASGYLSGTRY